MSLWLIIKRVIFLNKYFSFADDDIRFHYSYTEKPQKEHFSMHMHSYCEVYIFIYGKGSFKVEGNEYPLSSGDVLIMRENESHYIDIDTDYPYERMVINFDSSLFLKITKDSNFLSPFYDRTAGLKNIYKKSDFSQEIYNYIFDQLKIKHTNEKPDLIANALMLLLQIKKIFSKETEVFDETSLIRNIILFINDNIDKKITTESICDKFYISKSQLYRIFTASTGTTINNYINIKKIVRAKELLKSHTISETAIMSGFSDYSTFYRVFKKYYGCSPKQIKK